MGVLDGEETKLLSRLFRVPVVSQRGFAIESFSPTGHPKTHLGASGKIGP
jgi:hypothetical protein